MFVPSATDSRPHDGRASSARSTSGTLTFTTISRSKSRPALRSRYSCVGRAKQLWLTTPLAMKSPVPVVMSYIGSSTPSGSIEATRRSPANLIARPSSERLRVIAGSTVWKNRSCSGVPPSSRTHRRPFGLS